MFLFRKFALFIVLLIHLTTLFEFVSTRSDPSRRRTFVTKLSHYLSYDSPFYNASTKLSAIDLSLLDLKNSIARAKFLTAANNTSLYNTDDIDIEAPLSWNNVGFLAHIKVGSQLTNQFVYMDTGAGLLWINCEPCRLNVPEPIFSPRTSTTFRYESSCYGTTFTTFCSGTGPVSIKCNGTGVPCTYEVRYAKGKTEGKLARESFMFASTNKTLENIRFGCSRSTNIFTNGVMGLNNNRVSILSQLGAKRFGYCIGNVSDKAYPHNILVIGDDIGDMDLATPITVEDKIYLNLIAINVNDWTTIELDPALFKRNSAEYRGGMLVDTGSTYTFIPELALDKITEFVVDLMKVYKFPRNYGIYYKNYTMLCYDESVHQPSDLFIEFQFEGEDAIMEFYFESLFRQMNDESICLVMLPSSLEGLPTGSSIMGNYMQQYHYITYDLENKQSTFDRADCNEIKDLYV